MLVVQRLNSETCYVPISFLSPSTEQASRTCLLHRQALLCRDCVTDILFLLLQGEKAGFLGGLFYQNDTKESSKKIEFLCLQIHRCLFSRGKWMLLNTEKQRSYFSEANDNQAYLQYDLCVWNKMKIGQVAPVRIILLEMNAGAIMYCLWHPVWSNRNKPERHYFHFILRYFFLSKDTF